MGWENESEPNQLLQGQIQQNERELTAKRESLAKQRLAIIKSQGAPNFEGSGANAPVYGKAPVTRM